MLNYKHFVEKGCCFSYKYGSVLVPHCNFFSNFKVGFSNFNLRILNYKVDLTNFKVGISNIILDFSTLRLIFPTLMLEFPNLILELATCIFCCYYDKLLHFRRTHLKRDLYHARLTKKRSK